MTVASRMNGPWVRGALVLAIAALVMGALAITPAGSAADGLSRKEKRQGDKRWINVGEKAADADKLDGLDSKELSPVGGVGLTSNMVLTDAFETVLSTSVSTPGSATLLASAAVSVVSDGGGNDQASCDLSFDSTAISPTYRVTIPDTATADTASLPVVWAQPVGAGPHTVLLRCHKNLPGSVTVDEAGLMVSAHL